MEFSSYVDALRHELAAVAHSAGPDAEVLAERLTASLEAATRLVLQEAVVDAAQEISRALAPGSVDVRLRGRDLGFVIDRGPQEREPAPSFAPAPPVSGPPQDSEAGTARLTVRLPETLKGQIEAAAEREGLSVNAYLVRTLGAALQPSAAPAFSRVESGNQLSGWVQ